MSPKITKVLSKIGDILLSLLGTEAVKRIIIDKLTVLAKRTDNQIDDQVIKLVEAALLGNKDVDTLKNIYGKWTGLSLTDETAKTDDAVKE